MSTIDTQHKPFQCDSPHEHLVRLAAKYGVELPSNVRLLQNPDDFGEGAGVILPGWFLCDKEGRDVAEKGTNLLMPWRSERRFVELRNLVVTRTVEAVCQWRARCLSSPERWTLPQAIYREMGLCQWVLGEPFVSVYASLCGGVAANIVGRLASGIGCGIEINLSLPAGSALRDRHEAISRRGVASDQVVDSIVRPSSVYVMTGKGVQAYLDTDSELFGLGEDQTALVREAFALIRHPEQAPNGQATHQQICRVVAAVLHSAKFNQRIDVLS